MIYNSLFFLGILTYIIELTLSYTVDVYEYHVNVFHVANLQVKRYLGHQDSRVWKAVSDVLKSLNWSWIEI